MNENKVVAGLNLVISELPDTGVISDGYHTFDELYYHRAVLFSALCRCFPDKAWKSFLHHDSTMYPHYFVVGVTTPTGDYTYHYHENLWSLFPVHILPKAPPFDGHQPKDVTRLLTLDFPVQEELFRE